MNAFKLFTGPDNASHDQPWRHCYVVLRPDAPDLFVPNG